MAGNGTGGGPRTPAGKARASQNARRHGVLSKGLIIDGEQREEYEQVEHGWRAQFAPADYQEERLVEILVRNDWMLRRAERRYLEVQAEPWTSEQQHQLELMQRYRTAAERSFYRAWGALRGLRRDLERCEKESALLRLRNKLFELKEAATERSTGEPGESTEQPDGEALTRSKTPGRDNDYWLAIRAITEYLAGEAGRAGASRGARAVAVFAPNGSGTDAG